MSMTDKIVNLFPERSKVVVESPADMIGRMNSELFHADRAVLVLIKDVGGVWKVDFQVANMNNTETSLCMDIVKGTIMDGILGKC